MNARDVMVSPVITVNASVPLAEVARTLRTHRVGAMPVVDDQERVVGMISDGDLMRRAAQEQAQPRPHAADLTGEPAAPPPHTAADAMSPRVVAATPDTGLRDLAVLMHRNAIKRVPIVADGRLVGIVSRADLIGAIASGAEGIIYERLEAALQRLIPPRLPAEGAEETASLRTAAGKPRRPAAARRPGSRGG